MTIDLLIAFIVGLLAGALIGVLVMALAAMAGKTEETYREEETGRGREL